MKKWMKKIQHLSIKQKWSIVSALTIIVSYALISSMLYIAVYNWLLHEEERSATRTLEQVQDFFREQGATITIQDIERNKSLINAIIDQEQTIRIFNFDGYELIRLNNTVESPDKKPTIENILNHITLREKIDGEEHFVLYQPIKIGTFTGYFELIHPLATFHSMMKYIITLFLLLGMGAFFIALLLGSYIASILLKPIQQLRDSMANVKEHGLKGQPSVEYKANDEIGDLFQMYQQMLLELKESFDRQQQFVQDASHELRTPIQAIEGHLSLIQRWGKNDKEVLEESIQTSLEEVQRMKRLMEELLLLAKKDDQLLIQYVDPELEIKKVLNELSFIEPNFHYELTFSGKKTFVCVSEQAFQQIMRNIIENAIRYSDSNPKVDIIFEYKEESCIITIQDYGIGIAKEHLPYIFNRFYRVEESRKHINGSTGLGLSIIKMLADKYGIKISVHSEIGNGTAFMLDIPAKITAISV